MNFKIRYLKWRNGRPRWEPGPTLRAAGFTGKNLQDRNGNWLSQLDAAHAAEALNEEVRAWREDLERRAAEDIIRGKAGARRSRRPPKAVQHPRSCEALLKRYWDSADFRRLSKRSQEDYQQKGWIFLNSKLDDKTRFAEVPCTRLTKPDAFNLWEELERERGLSMANGIKAVVSPAFSYAELCGWRPANSNPWLKLGRPTVKPRLAIWLPEQTEIFLAAADELVDWLGRPLKSIGDTFVLGLHTGQRLSDILAMPETMFVTERIALTQQKRQAMIDAKASDLVTARVADIRARRRAGKIVDLKPSPTQPLIINEATGKPYTKNSFNKRWHLVRDAAAAKLPYVARDPRWQGPKLYEIAELTFQDTRDTYVTRSAMAGNDAAHIAAVTGHTQQSIHTIMKHYLALNRAMADAATERIEAWLQKENIKV